MKWFLILAIVVVAWILSGRNEENFDVQGSHEMAKMCHKMTAANCRIPTWQLNDCWLNAYRKCSGMCKGNVANCPCFDQASEKCRSNDSPAEACYASTYQKCMAGRVPGFPDPDR